jgi:Fic family protein
MDWNLLTLKKKRLDAIRPLKPELVQNLEEWFRVELTYTSNAIEGNTLTRQETAVVLEKGLTVGGRTLREHLEASNHAKALDWLKMIASNPRSKVGEKEILEIHALLLKGIDDLNAGRFRSVPVRIAGSSFVLPNPRKVTELMGAFTTWLHRSHDSHPASIAAQAHYRLVTIHPFVDGNGRTARLLMNLLLMQRGYPPAFIRTRERLAYLNALEKAQLGGSLNDFETLMFKITDRSLDIYINAAKGKTPVQEAPSGGDLLRIGALAKKTGESVATLRHWTKEKLLIPADHTKYGYTLYPSDAVKTAKDIRELQSKRWTLLEIKQDFDKKRNGNA